MTFPKNSAFTPTAEQTEETKARALHKSQAVNTEAGEGLDVASTLYLLRTASARVNDDDARSYIESAIELIEDSKMGGE